MINIDAAHKQAHMHNQDHSLAQDTDQEPAVSETTTNQAGFDTLGLSSVLLQALKELGYETPSAIQAQAIPAVLSGRDVMAAAQTGTGKTAGFTLPLLQKLESGTLAKHMKGSQVRALILTPTRELAAQVQSSVKLYGKYTPLKSAAVFGGVKINPQMMRLKRGADLLVATPGRLLDLYNQRAIKFDVLEVLVLDEADRMLDMGFIHDIKRIIALLPPKRQNLLFSATFSDDIRALAKGLVDNPVEISVTPRNTTAASVTQWVYPVDKSKKRDLLMHLISSNRWEQVLVFTRTKHGANRLTRYLEDYGIPAAAIHGNKSQAARTRALADFKAKKITALVATDIAARGIDIEELPYVVNYELPKTAEDYVHRIGRTGRASATGQAVSLVCRDEYKQLVAIERLIQKLIERKVVSGFEPKESLPKSSDTRPPKPKRAKKRRGEQVSAKANGTVNKGRGGGRKKLNENANAQKSRSSKSQGTHQNTHNADSKTHNPDGSKTKNQSINKSSRVKSGAAKKSQQHR